jgi:hypothetical protein
MTILRRKNENLKPGGFRSHPGFENEPILFLAFTPASPAGSGIAV